MPSTLLLLLGAHRYALEASSQVSFNLCGLQSQPDGEWVCSAVVGGQCLLFSLMAGWTLLTQDSYLAFVPTRDWCPTAIGTAPVGQKDGPSTETFKINEKQGKKKITVQAAK